MPEHRKVGSDAPLMTWAGSSKSGADNGSQGHRQITGQQVSFLPQPCTLYSLTAVARAPDRQRKTVEVEMVIAARGAFYLRATSREGKAEPAGRPRRRSIGVGRPSQSRGLAM